MIALTLREEIGVNDILITNVSTFPSIISNMTNQSLQVLPILPTQAAVSLPDPIPTRRVLVARGEEDDRIVRLDYAVSMKSRTTQVHERTIEIQIRENATEDALSRAIIDRRQVRTRAVDRN